MQAGGNIAGYDLLELGLQTGEKLQEIHNKGLIHNDFKSDNILVSGTPEKPKISIIDLGLACLEGGNLGLEGNQEQYPWMAPEVNKKSPSTQASDVYSYAFLMKDIMARVMGIPSRWLWKVKSALSDDPEKRPSLEKVLGCVNMSLMKRRRDAKANVVPQVKQTVVSSLSIPEPYTDCRYLKETYNIMPYFPHEDKPAAPLPVLPDAKVNVVPQVQQRVLSHVEFPETSLNYLKEWKNDMKPFFPSQDISPAPLPLPSELQLPHQNCSHTQKVLKPKLNGLEKMAQEMPSLYRIIEEMNDPQTNGTGAPEKMDPMPFEISAVGQPFPFENQKRKRDFSQAFSYEKASETKFKKLDQSIELLSATEALEKLLDEIMPSPAKDVAAPETKE